MKWLTKKSERRINEKGKRKNLMKTFLLSITFRTSFYIDSKWPSKSLKRENESSFCFILVMIIPELLENDENIRSHHWL